MSLSQNIDQIPINTNFVDPHAFFGGCWDGNPETAIGCAHDPSACTDPAKPFTGGLEHVNELFFLDFPAFETCHAGDIPAYRCLDSESLGTCTWNGCDSETTKWNDPSCNMVKDKKTEVATLYGGCWDMSTNKLKDCFLGPEDCKQTEDDDGEIWLLPDDLVYFLDAADGFHQVYCDCTDVRVGACRTEDGLICASNANQCGEGESFVTARTLMDSPDVYGNLDCRLCEATSITSDVEFATLVHLDKKLTNNGSSSKNSTNVKEAIGGVMGGVLGLLVLLCIGLYARRIQKNKTEQTEKTTPHVDNEDVPAVNTGEMS